MARTVPIFVTLHLDDPKHQHGLPSLQLLSQGPSIRLAIPIGSLDLEAQGSCLDAQGNCLDDLAKLCFEISMASDSDARCPQRGLTHLASDFGLQASALTSPLDEVRQALEVDPVLEIACIQILSGPVDQIVAFGQVSARFCMDKLRENQELFGSAIELIHAEPQPLGLFGFHWSTHDCWQAMMEHAATIWEAQELALSLKKSTPPQAKHIKNSI